MPKVLIVDDSLSVRRALERVLSAKNFDVVAARSGDEALERFAVLAPDLTIADIIMPGIGGFELCRKLRERAPQTPVILISGVGDARIEQQAHAAGAAAVISKPFTPEDLSAALEVALRSHPADPAQTAVPVLAAAPEPDLLGLLTSFLEKPEVLAAALSDRQGVGIAHVGESVADALTLASYNRFLLVASDVMGAHYGAEHTDGVVLEFPHAALYLGRIDARHILSLHLSDVKALGVVRYLIRKTLPDLAAGLAAGSVQDFADAEPD